MSLINQALRKAQRDRNPSRMADQHDANGNVPPLSTGYVAPASGGPSPALLVVLILGVVVLLGLVAGLTVVLLQKDSEPANRAEGAAAPVPQAAPAETPSGAVGREPTTPAASPASPAADSSVLAELRAAREAAEAKLAEEARAAAEAEAAARAAQAEREAAAAKAAAPANQEVIQWLSEAKVTGVRISSSGNKVIINNETYGVGETVHFGLGLKVLVIQESRILFGDSNDKKYMKRL